MSDETMACGHKAHRFKSVPMCLDCYTTRPSPSEEALREVVKTRDHYEKELADAKAKRDKRVYELTEVAYLASLRPHLAALSSSAPAPSLPREEA